MPNTHGWNTLSAWILSLVFHIDFSLFLLIVSLLPMFIGIGNMHCEIVSLLPMFIGIGNIGNMHCEIVSLLPMFIGIGNMHCEKIECLITTLIQSICVSMKRL